MATNRESDEEKKIEKTHFEGDIVEKLEKWIDEMELKLPKLKKFILPSGGLAAAHIHVGKFSW